MRWELILGQIGYVKRRFLLLQDPFQVSEVGGGRLCHIRLHYLANGIHRPLRQRKMDLSAGQSAGP